jgi:hypothetical protein
VARSVCERIDPLGYVGPAGSQRSRFGLNTVINCITSEITDELAQSLKSIIVLKIILVVLALLREHTAEVPNPLRIRALRITPVEMTTGSLVLRGKQYIVKNHICLSRLCSMRNVFEVSR